MTWPSGAGVITGPYGPGNPNESTQGGAPPFDAPLAAANVAQTAPGAATFNVAEGDTSTTECLEHMAFTGAQTGDADKLQYTVPTSNVKNVAEITPPVPSGTFVQSGSGYISNTNAVRIAGVAVSDFAYFSGMNGRNG